MPQPKRRILFLVSSLCVGGAEKHTVTLANQLSRELFDVSLGYLKPIESLLPLVKQDFMNAVLCLNVRQRLDRRAVRDLRKFLVEQRIDTIICTNEYPALYAWLACWGLHRKPRLVEVFHTTTYARFKEKMQMLLYRYVFRRFDLLVYVSNNQRDHWLSRGLRAARDVVIHNGVDLVRFSKSFTSQELACVRDAFAIQHDDYLIGICAALRPEKAHEDLVAAISCLRNNGTPAKALFIGDGPQRAVIEEAIVRADLTSCVFITGAQLDVRPFLAACDVVALTSHAVETFSIAALEAMAMGKPLVLTRIGGASELVTPGRNGFLFEPGDIASLTAHLESLKDRAVQRDMGAESMKQVQRQFSENRMLEGFTEQLLQLTSALA